MTNSLHVRKASPVVVEQGPRRFPCALGWVNIRQITSKIRCAPPGLKHAIQPDQRNYKHIILNSFGLYFLVKIL